MEETFAVPSDSSIVTSIKRWRHVPVEAVRPDAVQEDDPLYEAVNGSVVKHKLLQATVKITFISLFTVQRPPQLQRRGKGPLTNPPKRGIRTERDHAEVCSILFTIQHRYTSHV